MPQYDIKISKAAEEATKRRPSIELAPTLEKPIYIVSRNMNGRHILELIDCLEKQKIQYQMQQQTSTLGFVLNQRFFVIVDNKYGQVTLGAYFASISMTVVGYPKIGKNKKNNYYQKPEQIVKCYRQFVTSPDCIKMSKSLIKSNEGEGKVQETPSQIKRAIQVRSIIKYKSQDSKQSIHSHNSLKKACKKESQRLKLIVLEDWTNPEYTNICQSLFAAERAKDTMEKAENIDEIRKKTLFHTNKVKIIYLSTYKNSQNLINSIFIGQVIIFSLDKNYKLNQLINQPKIYAIAYQKNELLRILYKMGFDIDASKSALNSYLGNTVNFNDSKNSPFLLKNQSNIKQKEMSLLQNELAVSKIVVKQMSRIQNNVSTISQANEQSELNTSIMSKGSSCSRKIKRLGKGKSKLKSQISQNEKTSPSKIVSDELQRKKKLKNNGNQYYNTNTKQKKNLTFKQNLIEGNPIRKIKSISKIAPEILTFQAQNKSTMTEDYFNVQPSKLEYSSGSNFFSNSRNSSFASGKIEKPRLNGIFYRQFVPKFQKLAQIIKMKHSLLFFENEKQAYVQSFVYVKQYDRFVRRIKNKSKELRQRFEQYNFVVILREEDYAQFEQYCWAKGQYYDEEQAEFLSNFKENFSVLTKTSPKMNIYVFIQSQTHVPHQVISFGRIYIYKHKLLQDLSDYNLERALFDLKTRVKENFNARNRDYLCA